MEVRILGCSGGIGAWSPAPPGPDAVARGLRLTSSYLLDHEILLDAGTGVGALTHAEMRRVRHVFLTHSHLDHVGSLPLLVDTIFEDLKTPLVVHGLPVTIQALKDHVLNWKIWPDFAELPTKERPVMVYEPMSPGEQVRVGEKTLEMAPVVHAVPAVAYVVTEGERRFCYTGDTSTNDSLWAFLDGAPGLDLLLVECGFPNANEDLARLAKHYCPRLLARDLGKLRHPARIAITHPKPGGEDVTWQECVAAIRGHELIRVEQAMTLSI